MSFSTARTCSCKVHSSSIPWTVIPLTASSFSVFHPSTVNDIRRSVPKESGNGVFTIFAQMKGILSNSPRTRDFHFILSTIICETPWCECIITREMDCIDRCAIFIFASKVLLPWEASSGDPGEVLYRLRTSDSHQGSGTCLDL